jgi:hypothetical protein
MHEPAFAWWAPHVLRKKDRILSKVQTKYWDRTHKYGIRLPKSVKEALAIDAETGTDYWRKAIDKEMGNVRVAFEFNDDDKVPIGHQEITCHMIFDVKICLTRKARLVAGGHKVTVPKSDTFSSVVSRDSVRIFFMVAALNDLDVRSADIQNAYLTAPIKEKYWYRAGHEFGSDKGRPTRIVRALYGLPSAGKSFRNFLADAIRKLGYTPSRADPDVWMRPAMSGGVKYYEYLLAYVDDIIGCSKQVDGMFAQVSAMFKFKEPATEPSLYLGADISKWSLPNAEDPAKTRWSMSSSRYVKKAIAQVEVELKEIGSKLRSNNVKTPFAGGYRPELDQSAELSAEKQNYFQGLIGILRWICELGRIDILVATSMLSRYLASGREGHLEQAFHIFAYLKSHDRSTLVFDDTSPEYDTSRFKNVDWTDFYPDAKEAIPTDMPEPRGIPVNITCFVDASHADCHDTRRSHTGVLIFVNRAPVLWYSKRQTTVETSTFGSEIVALRIAIEMVEGLRYKLRMMGVPLEGPASVLCDNDSVVKSTTRPESSLSRKSNSIAYHKAREAQAAGIIRLAHEPGETNLADILTKLLPGPRLRELAGSVLW